MPWACVTGTRARARACTSHHIDRWDCVDYQLQVDLPAAWGAETNLAVGIAMS
jgi:hypothetical protein